MSRNNLYCSYFHGKCSGLIRQHDQYNRNFNEETNKRKRTGIYNVRFIDIIGTKVTKMKYLSLAQNIIRVSCHPGFKIRTTASL